MPYGSGNPAQDYQAQSQNPAVPQGVAQAAQTAYGYGSGVPGYENSALGQYTSESGYTSTNSLFTGANFLGTNNGWSTPFMESFIAQQKEAEENGTMFEAFSRPDATGVVTWDHTLQDGRQVKFGDVMQDGQIVANIYDQFSEDPAGRYAADLLMAPLLFDGTTQGRIFSDSDRTTRLASEIDRIREENNTNFPKAQQALKAQGEIEEKAEGYQEGFVDEVLTGLGGLLGGAATGFTTSLVTANPWTIAGGTVIGAGAGAFGAYANKDELTEQAARASYITELAFEEEGTAAGLATGLQQWAGFGMNLSMPFSNTVKGLHELTHDSIGDGEAVALPEPGEDKSATGGRDWGIGWEVANLGASVVDSINQFASPVMRSLYTAEMSGVIVGETGSLALTGGKMYDPSEGGFDNIFRDDEGDIDWLSGASGILKVGIDVAQLGMVRGLSGQASRQRAAVEEGRAVTHAAGHRFVLNESGEAVSKRPSLALLAPSEQVSAISASRTARLQAMNEGRAVTADDFYRAVTNQAASGNRLKAAMVNAFGEGYEEALQAGAETEALDGRHSLGAMGSAFAYGAAMGFGMGSAINLTAPQQQDMLKAQAMLAHANRFYGGSMTDEQAAEFDKTWAGLTPTEQRIRANLSKADTEVTRNALESLQREGMATLAATEPDMAKAMDARRSAVEKDLERATTRTDFYTQISGILDAGQVDEHGNLRGDTVRAEAAQGSAFKVLEMLAHRRQGLALQESKLRRDVAGLTKDSSDPEIAGRLAEAEQMLRQVRMMRKVGDVIFGAVNDSVELIYSDTTDEATAAQEVRDLNAYLAKIFDRRADVVVEGASDEELLEYRDAAAQFVTLLHSREPKLDTGSYLAILPQASWDLTRERAENFLQINLDVLQAINGDFDGDKLRAENQVILPNERYIQTRAGQGFGGVGENIDIATRNFDEALVNALGESLAGSHGTNLANGATTTLDSVVSALAHRYGSFIPTDEQLKLRSELEDQVRSGNADTRLWLLNTLASRYGQAITDRGRESLNNEWLWISKIVRANFQTFQRSYALERSALGQGPSAAGVGSRELTPEGKNARKTRATTPARTLAIFADGNTLFRKFQKIHYTAYNTNVLSAANVEYSDLRQMAELYEELSQGITQSELARIQTSDTIANRVLAMLGRLVDSTRDDPDLAGLNKAAALSVLANVKVKDVWWSQGEPVSSGDNISLAQLLLKRALDAERVQLARVYDSDPQLQMKHARLRAMTQPGDVNAARAFVEVFKGVPFGDSLGGITGLFGFNTTPEQWLAEYRTLDDVGRQQMEALFKSAPEYLDRKESSNLPYTLAEAITGAITPYRSMLDAMMAVGRGELTFDPAKPPAQSLSGDFADQNLRAMEDFREVFKLVGEASREFRKSTNRRGGREITKEHVQRLFAENPAQARQLLELIPDAAANAVFDVRNGELFAPDFIYEMFAKPTSDEAMAFYWRTLAFGKLNATLARLQERDADDPSRVYDRLTSRFERLVYDLAQEPDRMQLERLIRKMASTQSLDELFHWINSEPGIRGRQAPLLPFVDDAATFDPSAGNAWTSVSDSADLRAAMAALRTGAKQLRDTVYFRESKRATDTQLRNSIRRALTDDSTATREDRENLRKFRKALATSRAMPRGFGPAAMSSLIRGSIRGFDAHSHDKGQVPTSFAPLGEFQALMDAFGFVPGLERVMEQVTATNVSSLRSNIDDLARTSGVAMDADGRQIEWAPLTAEEALDMLDDERTAPLALSILTPGALELTQYGTLSPRSVFELSLDDLLDGSGYKELFARNENGALSLATSYKYLMMLDSMAKVHGGNFDVLRVVNDLAITRSSALTHEATEYDYERLTNEAIIDVANILQMVGRVQSNRANRDAELLKKLREGAVKRMRSLARAGRNEAFTDGGKIVEAWVKDWLLNLESERDAAIDELTQTYTGDDLARRVEALEVSYDANRTRIQNLLEADQTKATVQRFAVTGDPVVDQAARVQIVEMVKATNNFAARAPESEAAYTRLAAQLWAGEEPELSLAEWEQLSRSAMGVYLADQVVSVAGHVAVPGFPKGDPRVNDARFFKYFDTGFTYLPSTLLDESSPLTAAAVWLSRLADRPSLPEDLKQTERELGMHLLDEKKLGRWTPALMSHLVETQQRMDSSGAPGGIAAAGNGPKRWAAVAFATRRTGKGENLESLTSTASLSGAHLLAEADLYNEVNVSLAGGAAKTMPVAMLNNRFYAAVRFNGEEIPLSYQNMGYEWDGGDRQVPLRYIALPRLRTALERWSSVANVDPRSVTVELEFLHPDSQPAGQAHNAFFDGMSHSLIPDGSESLIATLWSDNGGEISRATQWPLDAGKKGLRSILPFRPVKRSALAEAQAAWDIEHDMSKMIQLKTRLVMQSDQGAGTLPDEHYNAVHKTMRLQHIVVGMAEGEIVAMTADEVIAFQNLHGTGVPLQYTMPGGDLVEFAAAKLVMLSPEVLRTMAGDTGTQGVPRFFEDEFLLNPQDVMPYTVITRAHLDRFGEGWLAEPASPADTSLAHVAHRSKLTVRVMETPAEINGREQRIVQLNNDKAHEHGARLAKYKFSGKAGGGGRLKRDFRVVLEEAIGLVQTERNGFEFSSLGVPVVGPRSTSNVDHTERLLRELQSAGTRDSLERGWRVRDEGGPDFPGGVLTVASLHDKRDEGDRIVKDDLVSVELNTFTRPERTIEESEKRLEQALDYVIDRGAMIVLGSGDGSGDLRYHGATYLQERGYAPVAGSKHLFAPRVTMAWTQDQKAYESTLVESQTITPAKNAITFLALDPLGTDENAAILDPGSTKLRDRALVNNLLPSSMFPHYNIALDDGRDLGLYTRALTHLQTMLDPSNTEARAALLKMAGPDVNGVKPIAQALDDFHAKIMTRSTLAPEVGDEIEAGDIIPFVSDQGRVILYRHGMKAPKNEAEARALQRENGGMNIALAKSKTEPMAKTNTGTISSVGYRAGYGRALTIEMPLQELGDKIVLELNGMKYVVVPMPSHLDLPTGALFRNGQRVDLWSDNASSVSKEAYYGKVNNYRNALAFFQFDFMDDMTSFFFPKERPGTPGWADSQVLTRTFLRQLARQTDFRIPFTDAAALKKAQGYVAGLLEQVAGTNPDIDPTWVDRLRLGQDAQSQIAYAVITYLLTSGVTAESVDTVLRSAGFSHEQAANETVTTRLVPGLFAELLDHGVQSALHAELINRWNSQLDQAPDGSGYVLHPNWMVEAFGPRRKDGQQAKTVGYLQFGEAHSSGDNPTLDAQAFDNTARGLVSGHNVLATAASLGGITAHEDLKRSRNFAKGFGADGGIYKFGTDGDSLWQMLTSFPADKDGAMAPWRRERLPEIARRQAAREEIIGFYEPLGMKEWGWGKDQRRAYAAEAQKILDELNLYGDQGAMVDAWVRQRLGRPFRLDENGRDLSEISFDSAMETLGVILELVRKNTLPTYGGHVPLMDVNHLTAIYMANAQRTDGWAPREDWGKDSPLAVSWDAWVEIAFGSAFEEERAFENIYLLAVDGFMHGYQGATSMTRSLPVSSELLRTWELMDPATEEQLSKGLDAYEETRRRASINPDARRTAEATMLLASGRAGIDQVVTGRRIYDDIRGQADPSSAMGKQKKRIERWRKAVDAPYTPNRTMRGVRRGGQSWLDTGTRTSAFFRALMNWRVAKTLLNPVLMIAAPVDAFYRRQVNMFANVAVGESTGAIGSLQAKIADRFSDTTIGGVAERLGWGTRYTSDQLKQLRQLIDVLASRDEFKSLVYQELMYQYPTIPGIGRIEKALEKLAKFGGRLQDPAWGMLPRDLSRIYLETVMENAASQGTLDNIYDVDTLINAMRTQPNWVQANDLAAHNMAIARIANIRSLKATPISLMTRGLVEPLSEHSSFLVNSSGNFLKLMTAFQNFWINAMVNFTGLQGASDFVAMMVDGREKKLGRRIQATLRGEKFDPDLKEHYDMSEVLESADLADSFIRGGVTHTGLFILGMMAGGLGLSGEDDEEKYRRRLAEAQGLHYIRDPRELQNDYNNKDAIFLDAFPSFINSWFKVPDGQGGSRSIMQMGMITRTIFSPIIGMERFFSSGDPSEIWHGFMDALGSHPIRNEVGINAAWASWHELTSAAAREADQGGPENMAASANFMTQAVGILDSLLLESAFLNAIYIGSDEYDRDPGALPATDSLGNQRKDVKGNPYSTSAIRDWVDAEESGGAYVTRGAAGTQYRTLSENRLGLAFMGAAWDKLTGGEFAGSDFFRQNMVTKTRDVELMPTEEETVEAYFLGAFLGQGGAVNLTEDEARRIVRKTYADAGEWLSWGSAEETALAQQVQQQANTASPMSPLLMGEQAEAVALTDEGARQVFQMLASGMPLDVAPLNGVFVSQEQREKIRTDWMRALYKEGIEMGLDPDAADSRMQRIWFGAFEQDVKEAGAGSLNDVVFTDKIPWGDKLTYNQLNSGYVTGPSGFPTATGFTRGGVLGTLGIGNRAYVSSDMGGLDIDQRLNSVDPVAGINTGLRALEARGEDWIIPTPEDVIREEGKKLAETIKDEFKDLKSTLHDLLKDTGDSSSSGRGWGWGYGGGYRSYGGYGGGGGGGGSYAPNVYFTKMNPLPGSISTYGNATPFINTSNPIIRRADVRRERVWSERGRLKQWQ